MRKKIGTVTNEERNEIQTLYERKNGLLELGKILDSTNLDLYNRLVQDMGETNSKFQNWWNRMSSNYQWESVENGNWEIDFDTCEIFLVSPK